MFKTKEKSQSNGKISNSTSGLPTQKSVIITYILWLFGGPLGLHHLYLHRDRHAFLMWSTLGGYIGIGWLWDIFCIPEYVRDANEDPVFIKSFVERLRTYQKPPYSSKRFVSEVMVGYFFGQLIAMAIPQTPLAGIDWSFLHWLIPVFIAIGVWTVGNVGREQGVLWQCLITALLVYPVRYFIYDETYTILITALASGLIFDHFSKEWLRTPPKRRGACERTCKLSMAICLYFSLWGCFLIFNGKITDEDGVEVPIHEAIQNFLATPWWNNFKQALYDLYLYAQHNSWYDIWKEIVESMDMDGERNAFKVLGVSATASQAEITAAYRRLSKEHHPDKVKDESLRQQASQRFIEINNAYNVLSKIKSSRRNRNRKSVDDATIIV